ncbi:hypothetical protein TUM19329_11080 [Legionella antarctica]|uniref:Ankyrin repeat protein n=1 Tax=Legionella antarctica TaxID=2708020 RepID=A0A6F8T3K3_9GAMM|nr:hypothetical protein [Legionella antarctica]BCA94747.1 hypothetical protein TUM19329_11080 [Legionella antarctica]
MMSKLHDIFHNKTPTIDRSKAVQELIQRENLDINEQDENGNTILHLMVQYLFDNYYTPHTKGPFVIIGANYNGPGFLDDLEFFLSRGANPSLKNKNQINPVEMLFGNPDKYNQFNTSLHSLPAKEARNERGW